MSFISFLITFLILGIMKEEEKRGLDGIVKGRTHLYHNYLCIFNRFLLSFYFLLSFSFSILFFYFGHHILILQKIVGSGT